VRVSVWFVALPVLVACAPPSVDECTETCDAQIEVYKAETEDDEAQKAYRRHRLCLGSHSCEEIAAGACYDEELFLIGG
jgi:hypothetical protein